jgi:hypothetical protein
MAKQTIKQRKAIRSAAARKPFYYEGFGDGWEAALQHRALNHEIRLAIAAPPKPSIWQRIKGWFA